MIEVFLNRFSAHLRMPPSVRRTGLTSQPAAYPHPLLSHPLSLIATIWILLLQLSTPIAVQAALPENITRISVSQQFIAHGLPADIPLTQSSSPALEYIQVDPNTAVVSCERIKQTLLQELELKDEWRGKIHLQLKVRAQDPDMSHITAMHYAEGWMYVVTIPEQVNRYRFLSTLIHVLLLEIANRNTGEIPAELPPWLADGLASHLASAGLMDNLSEPFARRSVVQRQGAAMEALRKRMRNSPPLTLNELNWPSPEHLGPWKLQYRDSAHLMVGELLRLKNGRDQIRQMILGLHQHLNWQTTFLKVFSNEFSRLTDFDKWWTVTSAHFLGTELGKTLRPTDAIQQLNDILAVPLEVRTKGSTQSLPSNTTLQHILSQWNPTEIGSLVTKRLTQLEILQWRTPQPVSSLVQRYREVLSFHLSQRTSAGLSAPRRQDVLPNAKLLLKKTLRDLDELDAQREKLTAQIAQASTPPASSAAPAQADAAPRP